MSTADLASAGRPPTGGGHPPSNPQHSNTSTGPLPGPFGLPQRFSPSGHPMNRGPQYGPSGPFPTQPNHEPSRSGTPSGNLRSAAGSSDQHFQNQGPAIAAPRPVPPFPRFTSPQPYENFGRSPSPSKRSVGPFNSGFGRDARDRWASIGQVQESGGSAATFAGSHDTPLHRPQSGQPPFPGPPSAGTTQDPFFGYGDFFGPSGPGNGPSGSANREFSPTNPNAPSGDRGFGMTQHSEDMRFDAGRFGHHSGDPAGYSGGHPTANGSAGPLNDPGSIPPGLAAGGMSPRSMMMFHNHHIHAQQGGMPGQPTYGSGTNHGSQGPGAHSLGSGLMSNSGQPAEEITTVFIVGFPDDMTERELANMFLFAKGFEASTLKIPAGGPTPGSGSSLHREMGGVNGALGAGGPYNAVNMPGSNMYDTASTGGWDDHALSAALSRAGSSDPFSLAGMGNALGNIGSASGSGPANAAGKIKQIIGFAKFRTRAEALEARDALNGKKIDAERGCVLKTEMAKKNLHTKQKPVLPGPSGHLEGPFGGPMPQGPGSMFHHPSSDRDSLRQAGNGPGSLSGPHPSSFPPSAAPGFEPFARGPSSALPSMISPSGGEGSYGSDSYGRNATRGGLEPGFGSSSGLSGVKTPGESSRSAAGDPWSSRGPLDYFGPSSEGKRGGEESFQPHGASEKQSFASSQHQQTGPRGPDWSAVGSPPRGGFSTKAAFGADASSRSAISPSKQSTSSSSSTSNTNHFHPHSHNYGKEDFGMGEPMTTITTPTTSRGESSRRGTRSTTSGGSFSGSPTKAGLTEKSMAASSSQASTSPPSALETPQSSNSLNTATVAGWQGVSSNNQQNSGTFAPRFGSLRLDSSQVGSASGNATHDKPAGASAGAESSGVKSPADLPSPTSRSFSIDQNPPGNTLFVGNLPSNSSASSTASLEDQLRQRFSACTGYRQLSFRVKNNGPMCFVEFDDVQNAARALAEVNGDTMNGAVKSGGLRLSFSKNPLFRNSCSANTATIGGASTPTSSTPAPAVSAGPQYASLGGLGENMRKQPPVAVATTAGSGASSAGPKNGTTTSTPAVDPFDSINTLEDSAYRDGFGAGSAHGKLHGTFEGRQLGREKGFEIWDEVGFYEGTARFWKGVLAKQVESVPANMRSRKQMKQLQHLNGLETLIAAFPTKNRSGTQPEPSPAALLAGASDPAGRRASEGSTEGGEDAAGADMVGEQEDPEALSKLDMSALLERIRARYKVVCASLGIPARGVDPAAPGPGGESAQSSDATKDVASAGGDGTAIPTGAESTNDNKNAAVIGGKVVDTTRLRF